MITSSFGLEAWVEKYLTDLKNANYSSHTLRAYASDLRRLADSYPGPPETITAGHLRDFLESFEDLRPATRARKQAALNSFFTWACRHDLITANPMAKLDPVRRDPPDNRALTREEVEKILSLLSTVGKI